MNKADLEKHLGLHVYNLYKDAFIALLDNGYDIDAYYDGSRAWGDVSRVLAIDITIKGASSYEEYVTELNNRGYDDEGAGVLSKNLFSRLTGIKSKNKTQTKRTQVYRRRNAVELQLLREATAKTWIEKHLDEARSYIKELENNTL